MSTHLGYHYILKEGIGKCGKPMWAACDPTTYAVVDDKRYTYEEIPSPYLEVDAGFCDEPAYGPAINAPTGTVLLCPKHGGPKEFHGGGI